MAEVAVPTGDIDVMVIGGGPAGSTIATLLADRGWSVVLADKDVHPRFHIGESLIPMNVPQLAKLGVGDEIERIGIRKYAAEFTSMYHDKTVAFEFAVNGITVRRERRLHKRYWQGS